MFYTIAYSLECRTYTINKHTHTHTYTHTHTHTHTINTHTDCALDSPKTKTDVTRNLNPAYFKPMIVQLAGKRW